VHELASEGPHDGRNPKPMSGETTGLRRSEDPSVEMGLAAPRPADDAEVRDLAPRARIGLARGACVVCIPVYGHHLLLARCLRSVLLHTPVSIPVLIADDGSPDEVIKPLLRELETEGHLDRAIYLVRQPENVGFVENVNCAFVSCEPADVILLNSDCIVAEGWFEGLRDAANSDSGIATSSALTNHGTILSVPYRNAPGPLSQDWTIDEAAKSVRAASLRIRPRIPTAVGHCVYVKRTALDLVGGFDAQFSPGYGEEVDFSQRCLARGMSHVAADDVLVEHEGGASFENHPEVESIRVRHENLIRLRYPYYDGATAAAAASDGALARALGIARRALLGTSVTIDGACLGGSITGTQIVVLETIQALARSEGVRLRVATPRRCGAEAQRVLSELHDVEVIAWDEVGPETVKTDIVHRPYQVSTANELVRLRHLGERLVITHLDMIAYRNPDYFRGFPEWQLYQKVTRDALGLADAVVFLSHHAAADVESEDLTPRGRMHVVGAGTDSRLSSIRWEPRRPRGATSLEAGGFLLCLGADYGHKNRLFALQMLDALQTRHGWSGRLAMAGPQVPCGSSSRAEAEFLLRHPSAAQAVVRLAAVTEGEKRWLLQRAAGVLYPTVYEGFGLVPFEAAAAGVPCFFAPQSALAEILPITAATIQPWDPAASADRVMSVLGDPSEAEALVVAVRSAGERFRWDDVARQLLAVYRSAADAPPQVLVTPEIIDLNMTTIGRFLVGEEGVLPVGIQNALWAISRRRYLRVPVFGMLRIVYRLGRLPKVLLRRGDR
jgi:GT2 family glycosyltransferase/glycosyltransferase involved in cell wall biosynthesis